MSVNEDVRFVCRREGHQPSLTITSSNPPIESYICSCKRCGRIIEVDVKTGTARVA